MKLGSVPQDKVVHFAAGWAVSMMVILFTPGYFWGVLAAIVAGIAKEVLDKYTQGDVDAWDASATALGGLGASIFFAVIT